MDDTFVVNVRLEIGSEDEFFKKAWEALKIGEIYPNEEVSADAFLDWARDLHWIDAPNIVVNIYGNPDAETIGTIEFLNEEWKNMFENSTKTVYKKNVRFITHC